MENNTPTTKQAIPEDILSTFTAWCKQADRSEADVHQELVVIDSNVMQLTPANREELMEAWRTITTYTAQVVEMVASLEDKWDGLDWDVEDGMDTPEYRKQVEADAARAWEEAGECAEQAKAGDFDEALRHTEVACSIESEYGDCPTYRPLRDLVRGILREKAEAEE